MIYYKVDLKSMKRDGNKEITLEDLRNGHSFYRISKIPEEVNIPDEEIEDWEYSDANVLVMENYKDGWNCILFDNKQAANGFIYGATVSTAHVMNALGIGINFPNGENVDDI
jgi:hypothetical protein